MVKIIFPVFFCFIFNCQILSQNCDSISFFEVESMPYFKGDINKFITNHLIYPKKALNDSISGTVYVLFIINEDGRTFNHKVVKGIRKDMDNEALRVAKLIEFEKPAINDGKPIKYKYLVSIKFNLEEKHNYIMKKCSKK